ncbi:phosphoserine phosphatase SerB [Citricoccus sp. SGAir0253]|uniref:phosphoserine phosphatase SerB n=1 Tax=Citricoccus sp. SGAir0253 TaxID=2567881 RepID=UPI0010CD5952|nr:phosphoserine phosphatase SerB [Citricoccus sp. SGAir0253]QCU78094.1 phosphoserine phosphatase SerB [Citricoccus sp. SGAir0253]
MPRIDPFPEAVPAPLAAPGTDAAGAAGTGAGGGDLVLVYAPGTVDPVTGEAGSPEVGPPAPEGVPGSAEPVAGVGFHGWRWTASAGTPAPDPARLPGGTALAVVPAAAAAATPRMLVMDVDSTLIRQEVIELLAAHAGREAEVATVTEAAMRGELDFAQSLHHRVQALAGLDAAVVDRVVAAVEPQHGAREVIAAFRAAGWQVCAVSGGFTQVLAPLAADLGLDRYRANDLEIVDGRLTGRVTGTVVDRAVKARMLRQWAAEAGVEEAGVIAAGDGANDIDMLEAAGLAVAFCAKPALREHADVELDLPTLDVIRALAGL